MSSPLSAPSSPLSTVDAEDLAQSLDSLLEVIPKNCTGELCLRSTRSEQLIARYHAQLAEKAQECTGFAASWCPRCGDCTCDRLPSGERIDECAPGNTCPLHGFTSTHAEPQQPEPSKPALSDKVGIWDAINRYVVACGGDPSSGVYGNTSRQTAVTDIERSIDASKPALSEVEKAAVNVLNAFNGCGEGDYDSHSLPDAVFTLRDVLRKRGAL